MKTNGKVQGSSLFSLRLFRVVRVVRGSSRSLFAALVVAVLLVSGCRTVSEKPDDFVELTKMIPGLVLDIRYATTNNFTGQKVYPNARCFLRRGPAEKLKRVQNDLASEGLGLRIFDGFRPLAVQRKFWEIMPDDRYVANPAKGSRHNRGAAVDLTLIRLADGQELRMPTPFDDFSERAGRDFANLPAEVIRNRELLRRVMEKHGFVGLATEWWHFDDVDWRNYPLADLPQ